MRRWSFTSTAAWSICRALQRVVSLASRIVIVALLVLALAGLTLYQPTREQFVIFALDRSLSVGEESRRATEKFLDQALASRGNNGVAYLDFAAQPGVVHNERTEKSPELDDKGTDLAAAIEVAAGAIPPSYVPHIVLLSDGNQTSGDALKAALRAGIPVSVVPLKTREDPEVQVSAVEVPAQVREGEPFNVEVVIDTNHDDEGTVEIYRGPHKVLSERHRLKTGENRFRFRQSLDARPLGDLHGEDTRFTRDTLLDNNSDFGARVHDGKAPRALGRERPEARQAPDLGPREQEHCRSTFGRRAACPTPWPSCRTTSC